MGLSCAPHGSRRRQLTLIRVGPLGGRHLLRHLQRFEDAPASTLGVKVRVRSVVGGAEAASALEQREAPSLHGGDLRVYVLDEVAQMVYPLAMLVQEPLVDVRASNRFHQFVEHRSNGA